MDADQNDNGIKQERKWGSACTRIWGKNCVDYWEIY